MTSHGAHEHSGSGHRRSVALFGGTFDPVHAGHIAVAQAAQRRFHLDTVYFIPSSHPPHKPMRELAPFVHRYSMVTLACAGHPGFVPSLADRGHMHFVDGGGGGYTMAAKAMKARRAAGAKPTN